MTSQNILEVKDLHKEYVLNSNSLFGKKTFEAIKGVNFEVKKGQTLGLVGESGCGKSTLGKTILRLLDSSSGKIIFDGEDITNFSQSQLKPIRRNMQVIFQDPYASLNARMSIKTILEEPLKVHKIYSCQADISKRVSELLDYVNISKDALDKYPHQFSGGQRQRICIARALAFNPKLIICDESVSALDVSIQSQIINLLLDLQKEFGLSYIFISHDLKVVRFISDKIAVMYFGKIVEFGDVNDVFQTPKHEYTKALLSAIPGNSLGNLLGFKFGNL